VSARYVEAAPAATEDRPTPTEEPRTPREPDRRDEPKPTPAGGGGSAFGSIVKWGCLLGAAACAGLALNERSQGDDAYDEYKDLVNSGASAAEYDAKFEEAEDHDSKAQTFWIASGGLFAAWFVGQFLLGGGNDDSADAAREPAVRISPGAGEVRASVVLARF
jgi:hypothetical protein